MKVKEVLAIKEWIDGNQQWQNRFAITKISEIELERISQLTTPNQVLAIIEQRDPGQTILTKGKITLALDTIQDPGNMGAMVRIADWFGLEQLVCSHDSADVYNPKVIQSSMGSIARVNVFYVDLKIWLSQQKETRIYAATLEGQDITGMKKPGEAIIIIGNESKGISAELLALANVKITIPRKGKAESLNAAVAAGLVLGFLS